MYVIALQNTETAGGADAVMSFLRDNVPTPDVLVGNTNAASVNLPTSVTVDVDPSAATNDRTLTLPGSMDLDQITVVDCKGTVTSQAFGADPAEVDVAAATLGTCAPQEEAFVIYFVTVNDA